MDKVTPIATPIGSLLALLYIDCKKSFRYTKHKIGHSKNLEDNYKKLKEAAEDLSSRRSDIENAAKSDKTKQLLEECNSWIKRAKEYGKEAQSLALVYEEKYKNQNGKFWDPLLHPDRVKFSKQMAKKCEELRGHLSKGILTSVKKLPERVMRTTNAPKIEKKSSLCLAVEEILGHLRAPDVRKVGLWGIVGVGKTAIMQNVNNNANIAEMFDIVIWLPVPKDWNIEKLQCAIMQRLELNVEDITKPNEAIRKELEGQKYLLLLDEVCEVLDLPKIGIESIENGSKVVLATRSYSICHDMETDREVEVQRLSKKDAFDMFKEKLGENVNLSGIKPIAEKVVDECSYLPFLIEKIASACRRYKEDYELWSAGLRTLQWLNTKVQGMDEVIGFLEFCYNQLGDEEKKYCFLYGALYPGDCEIYIDHLLECWKAENFIRDANEFRVARQEGWKILNDLILSSLLERSEKVNHVMMNKVVRRMAHKVSKEIKGFKILVKAGEQLQEAPNEAEWQQAVRISLMDNKLCTLPEKPFCSSLSTLFLQRNLPLKVIPESFFELMQELRVLDLHDTRITSLPSSISSLTRLKALYLNSCKCLRKLPTEIKKLECLEILDIRGTEINFIPIEIRGLIGLKCIRLSLSDVGRGQSSDAEFGKDVLSTLSSLEELRIIVDNDFLQLGTVMKDIIREVASLKHLTSLSICFPGVDDLEVFISEFPQWKDDDFKFQFSVGSHDQTRYKTFDNSKYKMRWCLKFANGEGVHSAISTVLARSDAFELTGHKGASKLSDFFAVDNINRMRGCWIEGCHEIETLVDGNSITNSALTGLEEMHINSANKLTSIWDGVFHTGSLAHLKTLTLSNCKSLRKIFSKGMIEHLSGLQNLKVEECSEIVEIIMESENSDLTPDVLPNLKTLVLLNLQKVRSIWISNSIKWLSLKKIEISNCPLLTRLPFNNENAINLKCIEVQEPWWNALACTTIKERLGPICHFK